MILGRNPALWLALIDAILNAAVVVFGVNLTPLQIASLNGLAVAAIGVVANAYDPTTAPTFAKTTKAPAAKPTSTGQSPTPPTFRDQ